MKLIVNYTRHHYTHTVVDKYLVNGAKNYEQVTGNVDAMPEREQRSSLPPAQLNAQLCTIERTHCLYTQWVHKHV